MALVKPTRHNRRIYVQCSGCARLVYQLFTEALEHVPAFCARCRKRRQRTDGVR